MTGLARIVALASLCCTATLLQVAPAAADELDDQLNIFLNWFPGEYDNH